MEVIFKKANPLYGESVQKKEITKSWLEAKQFQSSKMVEFITKRFNMYTQISSIWLNRDTVRVPEDRAFTDDDIKNRIWFVSMDLSKSQDMTGIAFVSAPINEDDDYKLIIKAFLPEMAYKQRMSGSGDRIYQQFVDEGTLKITNGAVIDHDIIADEILSFMTEIDGTIDSVTYDRFSALRTVTLLDEAGIVTSPMPQGFISMSPAINSTSDLIVQKKLNYRYKNSYKLWEWSVAQCQPIYDTTGNIKLDKSVSKAGAGTRDGSAAKIDVVIAAVMSVSVCERNSYFGETTGNGIYIV